LCDQDPDLQEAEADGVLLPSSFHKYAGKDVIAAAEVGPFRKHDMRHAAVALWIASGTNVKEVQTRAGRTKISTTLDHYRHLFPNVDDVAVSRLGAMIASSPVTGHQRGSHLALGSSAKGPRKDRGDREKTAGFCVLWGRVGRCRDAEEQLRAMTSNRCAGQEEG
jgi:hypothetical protein